MEEEEAGMTCVSTMLTSGAGATFAGGTTNVVGVASSVLDADESEGAGSLEPSAVGVGASVEEPSSLGVAPSGRQRTV